MRVSFTRTSPIGFVDSIENTSATQSVEQQNIMFALKSVALGCVSFITPNYFILEFGPPKHRIHEQLQVVAGRGVAMEIDRSCLFQDSAHLKQPHGHHDQVRLRALSVGLPSRPYDRIHSLVLIGYFAVPRHVHIIQSPGVLKRCSRCLRADGSRVGPVAIEGRVKIDQVHGFGVHPPHDGQVIASPHGAGFEVGLTHSCFLSALPIL